MSIESVVALVLLVTAVFCHLILAGIYYGAFDAILIAVNNLIVKRIELLEREDI